MALIHDYKIKGLGRNYRIVDDIERLAVSAHLVERPLFGLLVQLAPLEHRIDALDRRDADAIDRIDGVRGKALHVVEFGELAPVVRRRVLLKLFFGLLAQVGPVYQKQHPPGVGELDKPVAGRNGGIGLAATRCHLDQRPGAVFPERCLESLNRLDLTIPQSLLDQRRHRPETRPERLRLLAPRFQGLGPVEGKHTAGAGVRVALVPEVGFNARAFISKGQLVAFDVWDGLR